MLNPTRRSTHCASCCFIWMVSFLPPHQSPVFATRISPSDFCRNISYREVTIYKVSSSTTDFPPKYLLFSQKYRTFALSLPSVGNLQRSRALNQLISVLYFFHDVHLGLCLIFSIELSATYAVMKVAWPCFCSSITTT